MKLWPFVRRRSLVAVREHHQPVAGESFYQPAIWRALGTAPTAQDERAIPIRVVLKAEPNNRHDRNAIAVESASGETLGYLPRKLAAQVRLDRPLTAGATVRGGFALADGGIAHLGITLGVEVQ